MKLSLACVPRGTKGKIVAHEAKGSVRQRLLDLGLIPPSEFEVVRYAPLGDPIEVRVGSNSIVLRRSEAKTVKIEVGQ